MRSHTGLSPSAVVLSITILLANRFVTPYWWPHNPAEPKLYGLGFFLFARRYWGNRIFSLLSYGYLDVSVHRVSLVHLWIGCTIIQGSRDQRLFDGFPELIAAFHALHRLLTPRHPPHALSSLTTMILASRTDTLFAAAGCPAFTIQNGATRNGRPVNKFTTLPVGFANRQALVTRHVPKSFVILTR